MAFLACSAKSSAVREKPRDDLCYYSTRQQSGESQYCFSPIRPCVCLYVPQSVKKTTDNKYVLLRSYRVAQKKVSC